jgi:(p)ppGpp synthase/HD superfamily hydrolase
MDSMISKARKIAFIKHQGQRYGTHRYEYHLRKVADSVLNSGGGNTDVAVAYLHDILEDTDMTLQDLQTMFHSGVTEAVVALTKVEGEKPSEYLDKVAANEIALTVKMHDTLCNLTESLKTGQLGRVRKYSAQLNKLASYK